MNVVKMCGFMFCQNIYTHNFTVILFKTIYTKKRMQFKAVNESECNILLKLSKYK